jgi:hypothetical protein
LNSFAARAGRAVLDLTVFAGARLLFPKRGAPEPRARAQEELCST